MNRRFVVCAMVMSASLLAGGPMLASPTLGVRVPVQAKFGKTRSVSLNLRNDTKQPVKVKAGDAELTLEPGKVTPLKLNEGQTIVAQETTPERQAGSIIATVTSGLSGATIALH